VRRIAIGVLVCAGIGAALWPAAPALADGSLTINPDKARPGQSIGITTAGCNTKDGTATISSEAFNQVSTEVSTGHVNTSVTIRRHARAGTYKVSMICQTSHVRLYGQITVKPKHKHRPDYPKCWRDLHGKWHGKCHRKGPDTGGGGSLSDRAQSSTLGLGLLGTGAAVGGISLFRRFRT
jgi:hypothetical protein